MKTNAFQGQRGFTLIELVVVITILGILAAVAFPRFANMQHDARVAKVNAVAGAMQSAVAQIHGVALARAGQGAINNCTLPITGTGGSGVALEGSGVGGTKCVTVTNFYPAAGITGIGQASLTVPSNNSVPTQADFNAQQYNVTGNAIQVLDGTGAYTNNCAVSYIPAAAGGVPAVLAPVVTAC